MDDNSHMTFGKYGPSKGDHRLMKDVPSSYLLWLWDNVLHNSKNPEHQSVKEYVLTNYRAIIMGAPDYIPINPPID